MIELVLAMAALAGEPAQLSPKAQALVSAIDDSIQQVRARQAAEPPPKNVSERLLRLGELDQAPREVIVAWDFSTIPEAERAEALARAGARIDAVDHADQTALLKLVPAEGWFASRRYGRRPSLAAFHIIQHADLPLQERFLPIIKRMVTSGDAEGESYAMMYDRVEISHGRPQLYGSQFRCDGGKWRPYPIADPGHLDARRKAFGMFGTFAEYKVEFDRSPPCPQTQSPPPPGMKLD